MAVTSPEELVDWRYKGFPPGDVGFDAIAKQQWNAVSGDFLMPLMILRESALSHNLELMSRYCEASGVSLAPHGKTTMAPTLFSRQIDAGAWAITVASVSQARVARAFGVERVFLANEVVERAALRWLSGELQRDSSFDCYCLVDSLDGVQLMRNALSGTSHRPLPVLVEVGVKGGRAGCRTFESALDVARAVHESRELRLVGVEAFEGILDSGEAVDSLLERAMEIARAAHERGWFGHTHEVLMSAGGSAWFDHVVSSFKELSLDQPIRIVLRSGCYISHDDGSYACASPLGGRISSDTLTPALEVWGAVVSRPESALAIVNFGRRDAPFDAGLPRPKYMARQAQISTADGIEVTALNDQHAYLRVPSGLDLAVGDLVGCGISHPCTAFDKWRLIPVVDDEYRVIDVIRTFF